MSQELHTPSHIIVHTTTDYSRFRFISGNRELDIRKDERIIDEINSGNDMLEYYPINVKAIGSTLEILDGQNRFFVCQKLKRPVYYIIVREAKTMSDIARVNSNVGKWLPQNFINCYINNNNENYIQLQKFIDNYGFNVGLSVYLLEHGMPNTSGIEDKVKDRFQKGEFISKFYDEARQLAEECKLFNSFASWRDRTFVTAIYRIREAKKVTIAELHTQFLKNPETLVKCVSIKKYIFVLEQMMNFKKHMRIFII